MKKLPEHLELKSFLDHLEDLRRMLLQVAASLLVGVAICFPLVPQILDWLKRPLYDLVDDPDRFLRTLEVVGAFSVALKTALWGGLLLAMPAILYFLARFVLPGLTGRERQVVFRASGFAVVLFAAGAALGYFMTLPVALDVMLKLNNWLGIEAEWTINSYVAFVIQLLIGFGLAFELPLLVVILGRLGIVTSTQLREKRRHVIVFLLIIAMLLTPPDVFTQMMMAVPLALLYEGCIWLVWAAERKDASRRADGGGEGAL